MPAILDTLGPERVLPNHVAQFEARLGPGWSKTQREQISWRLELDGQVLEIREDIGPILLLTVPPIAAGRRARATPYHAQYGMGPWWEGRIGKLPEPGDDEVAAFDVGAASTPYKVAVRQDGKKWLAKLDAEPEFVVGQEFKYGKTRLGLFNSADPLGPFYDGKEWESRFGIWARLLEIQAKAESEGSFAALNTWDTANFTFGFTQFAAHTPDENLVVVLRKLLALPGAARYFPELSLDAQGRIRHKTKGQLESATSTVPLMAFLNPTAGAIDEGEVSAAGRLMHWTRADRDARAVQVECSVAKMKKYLGAKRADLDGKKDVLCFLVADIAHQGRAGAGGYAGKVQPALKSSDPENALLDVGADAYPGRIKTLRAEIARLRAAKVVDRFRYDAGKKDLVAV